MPGHILFMGEEPDLSAGKGCKRIGVHVSPGHGEKGGEKTSSELNEGVLL